MPANPRNSILDDQSIGGKMVSGCKCLMKVHEIIHQEWSPTPSSLRCLVYVMLAFLCNHFQLLKDSILNFYTVYRINFAHCKFCHFVLANSFSLKFSQTHFSFCSRLLKIRPFFNSPSDNEGEKG